MDEQELRMVYSSGFESLKKHAAHIIRLIELKIFDLFKLMVNIHSYVEIT